MGKVTELNQAVFEAEMKKIMDMQYGKSGYKVSIFTNAKGSKYKAIFSGFAEPANNGEFTIIGAMTRRWLPTITQEFRQRMETTGDGQTKWNSRELKTKDYREYDESLEVDEKERTRFDDIMDLRDKYDGEYIPFKITDAKPSAHGKGYDITAVVDAKGYDDLPDLIKTDMVKFKKEPKRGDKFKATLYISAGGILIDKIK